MISYAAGDTITFTPDPGNKRLRSLLQSGGIESDGILVPSSFVRGERPQRPSGFDPQNGTVDLKTVVFLINVAGSVPPVSASVSQRLNVLGACMVICHVCHAGFQEDLVQLG